MNKIFKNIIYIAVCIFYISCEKDSPLINNTFDTVDNLLIEGWELYADGQYDDALGKFENATARDAANIESYIGRGWTNIRLGQFNSAKLELNMVINLATTINDLYSVSDGYAGLYQISIANRYTLETDPSLDPTAEEIEFYTNEAIFNGENVLVNNPEYVTNHDPKFTFFEIHKSLAQLYFYLQRFQNALEHVEAMYDGEFLNSNISVNTVNDTLNIWVNKSGEIQTVVLGETGNVESINLSNPDVIRLTGITELNTDEDVLSNFSDYLYQDNSIKINEDYQFNSYTETINLNRVSHAEPGEPAANFDILVSSNYGIVEIESVNHIVIDTNDIYFRVDTSGTISDTTIADGIYNNEDTCCYFYSEQEIEQLKISVENAEIWTPLNPEDELPIYPDNTIIPEGIDLDYNYNFILIPPGYSENSIFEISYKYGQFVSTYETVENYMDYLNFLNESISLP